MVPPVNRVRAQGLGATWSRGDASQRPGPGLGISGTARVFWAPDMANQRSPLYLVNHIWGPSAAEHAVDTIEAARTRDAQPVCVRLFAVACDAGGRALAIKPRA